MNVAYDPDEDEWFLWHCRQQVARIQTEQDAEMFQEFIGNHYNLMEQLRESTFVLKTMLGKHASVIPLDDVDSIGNLISDSEQLLIDVAKDDDSDDEVDELEDFPDVLDDDE